ncbi:hypothetical protein PUN28_012737 [Cardiocondyla obscurior]|uniref:Uncharacterized protein n=1 Tax=Cardiocondyla obscurior TaxID=286306 RepID=A0AAW2F4D4_9HYME
MFQKHWVALSSSSTPSSSIGVPACNAPIIAPIIAPCRISSSSSSSPSSSSSSSSPSSSSSSSSSCSCSFHLVVSVIKGKKKISIN